MVTMRGLSSYACLGFSQARLIETARIAGRALEAEFENSTGTLNGSDNCKEATRAEASVWCP